MGRQYAGILACIAFFSVIVRGLLNRSAVDQTMLLAVLSLIAFGAVGYVVGWLADRTVTDAVFSKIDAELSAQEAAVKASSAK